MAIVAIIMAVVRHVGNRRDRSWLGELGRFDYFKRVERLDRSTLACPATVQGGAVKSEWLGCGGVGIAGDDDCNKSKRGNRRFWDGMNLDGADEQLARAVRGTGDGRQRSSWSGLGR